MQSDGKKLHRQASNKLCLSKREFESKVNSPFRSSKNMKICKIKPRSHAKSTSKRHAPDLARNNSPNGKSTRRKTLPKKLSDTNTTEKQLSPKIQDAETDKNLKDNDGDAETQKIERRRKRKKRKRKQELDDASRLRTRTRYLLIKLKLEQNLIDAYSAEGWNGQSREKIKPEKELQRAEKEILKCKLGIRDAIRQLEILSSEGSLENSVVDPDGSVFHEHIFCAKCKLGDAFPDNDIILCDGTCNCAFHQKCLEPPLATKDIPPEDEGWLCKYCECKMEILEVTNAHLGTQFSEDSKWQEIFWEAAMVSDQENASLNPEEEWPSDDSEDDDYDPDSRTATTEDNKDDCVSSLLWTSEENGLNSSRSGSDDSLKEDRDKSTSGDTDKINFIDSSNSLDSLDSAGLISKRRRHRRDVDYKKLHDEMFGKDVLDNEQFSEDDEDEDWGPRRKKARVNESDATDTPVALCDTECTNVTPVESEKKPSNVSEERRRLFRIPPKAAEKLRKVFAENELPPRAVRENLSKQLGIPFEKINKWFKNARYAALKIRKSEGTKHLHSSTGVSKPALNAKSKAKTAGTVASKDTNCCLVSSALAVHRSKILRKAHQRKNQKSVTSPLKKKRCRRAAGASPADMNEESPWSSKSENLDKPISSFKRKPASKKKSGNSMSSMNDEPLYMAEMERICQLQDEVEKLKKILRMSLSEESCLDEGRVVYVPIVEVKEKSLIFGAAGRL